LTIKNRGSQVHRDRTKYHRPSMKNVNDELESAIDEAIHKLVDCWSLKDLEQYAITQLDDYYNNVASEEEVRELIKEMGNE